MSGGYVICAYDQVKEQFPEFKSVMAQLKSVMIAEAENSWGKKFGGMTPEPGQFGWSTIIPSLFNDMAGNNMATWEQTFTALGHQTIITGSNAGAVYEDYKIGLAGLAFLSKAIRISEIRMQIGDRKLPRVNIEEAFAYDKPAVIFEEGFVIDEENSFDLYAYVLSLGVQKIMPIGFELNRVYDKLISNTGSALL